MRTANYIFLCLLLFTFVVGVGVCLTPIETMETLACPDLLLGTSEGIFLWNTKMPRSEKNPRRFSNMDEYIAHVTTGQRCPILYLQQENNAQGENVYSMRPSPFSMQVDILDASRENPPFNQNMYPGFDAHGQDVGRIDPLDIIHQSTSKSMVSDNPMDPNWGGVTFSQEAVLSGKYADRVVGKPLMMPKVVPI